jgi:hypothetical protein
MRRVFNKLGFAPGTSLDPQTIHLTLKLA